MKNKKKFKLICFVLMFFVCISASSKAFASTLRATLYEITNKYNDANSSVLETKKYSLRFENFSGLSGVNVKKSDDGKTCYLYSTDNEKVLKNIYIKTKSGEKLATISSNSIVYNDGSQGGKSGYYVMVYPPTSNNFGELYLEYTLQIKNGPNTEKQEVDIIYTTDKTTITEGDKGWFAFLWGLVTDTWNTITDSLQSTLNDMLIPLGDGIIGLISASVGETVTVEKIIFNQVDKINIDYWNLNSNGNSVRAIMARVVNPWYKFFYKIAIIVYMMILVYVGIQVMLSSTSDKKAKYKDVMVSWVVGIVMLVFFPYVMKYIVKLNDAVVQTMYKYNQEQLSSTNYTPTGLESVEKTLAENFWDYYCNFLGKDEFAQGLNGYKFVYAEKVDESKIVDAIVLTRVYAQKMNKIVLVIIYFIFIGQIIALLFMYYKRAFMLAFLIVIYPIVAMTYVLDKVGDKRAQSFEIWFKEYIINVIVQIFHAATYIVVVGAAFSDFRKNNGDNWLFLILAVLFLFQGEKILRGIFGAKSAANTIGDLAASGMAAYAVAKSIGGLSGGKGKADSSSDEDKADSSGAKARTSIFTPPVAASSSASSAPSNVPAPAPSGSGSGNGGASAPSGASGTNSSDPVDNEEIGYTSPNSSNETATDNSYNSRAAKDTVLQAAMKRRMKRGIASRSISRTGSVVGGIMGATMQMAKGGNEAKMAENVVSGALLGSSLGRGAVSPVAFAANKAEQVYQANKTASNIESGRMDAALGLNGMPVPPPPPQDPNIDPEQIVSQNGRTMEQIYREALAEYARVAGSKGTARAEQAYWKYIENNTKSE